MPTRKRIKIGLFAFLCFLLLLYPAGCANNGGVVDTLLTLDTSCAGERSMKIMLPGVDLNGETGLAIDALLNDACPEELTYSKEADGYRFSLRFHSYEDYVNKLTSLLRREPQVVFAMPDTVLTTGCRLGGSGLLSGLGVGTVLFLLLLTAGLLVYEDASLERGGAAILCACLCGGGLAGLICRRKPKKKRKR